MLWRILSLCPRQTLRETSRRRRSLLLKRRIERRLFRLFILYLFMIVTVGAALHTRLHARIRHPVRASARPRVLPAHLPWACRSATVRVLYYRKAMPPVCAHAHTATSEIADAPKLQARAAFYTTSCSRGIGGLRISEVFVPMTESMIP